MLAFRLELAQKRKEGHRVAVVDLDEDYVPVGAPLVIEPAMVRPSCLQSRMPSAPDPSRTCCESLLGWAGPLRCELRPRQSRQRVSRRKQARVSGRPRSGTDEHRKVRRVAATHREIAAPSRAMTDGVHCFRHKDAVSGPLSDSEHMQSSPSHTPQSCLGSLPPGMPASWH